MEVSTKWYLTRAGSHCTNYQYTATWISARDKLTSAPRGLIWPPVILAKNCGCEDRPFPPPSPEVEVGDQPNGTSTYIEPVTGALLNEGSAGAYDAALYQPATLARSVRNLDAVGDAELKFYAEEGYLSVD